MLGLLFSKIKNKSEIPEALSNFEQIRKPRTSYLRHRSLAMGNVFTLKDGEAQKLRDHQLLHEEPFEGFPNILSDPVFRNVVWGYDAGKAMDMVVGEHVK